MWDLEVYGLGVAGSTLAYLLSRAGFRVVGYDVSPRYGKACGDVVTLRGYTWELLKSTGSILGFVRRFEVRVDGLEVEYIDFGRSIWAMIDKGKLVNSLRSMAEAEGAKLLYSKAPLKPGGLISVDARGPYAHSLEDSVLTVRLIARAKWEPDLALIDFRVQPPGFYWVFPLGDEGRVNMGAGFIGLWNARLLKSMMIRYYRKLTDIEPEILDFKGAPVAVKSKVRLYDNTTFKIGEAAGLVNSTSGEGNRYAIHSAIALARAIKRSSDKREILGEYKRLTSNIVEEITLSRKLLELTQRINPRTSKKILSNLPRSFWIKWLQGRITWRTLILTLPSLQTLRRANP